MLPLQLIDSFLLDYHLGHILLVVFVLATVGTLPLKDQRIVGLNVIAFGLIFAIAPFGTMSAPFILMGIALLVIGPMIYVTAD